jgi:hypothetical protein
MVHTHAFSQPQTLGRQWSQYYALVAIIGDNMGTPLPTRALECQAASTATSVDPVLRNPPGAEPAAYPRPTPFSWLLPRSQLPKEPRICAGEDSHSSAPGAMMASNSHQTIVLRNLGPVSTRSFRPIGGGRRTNLAISGLDRPGCALAAGWFSACRRGRETIFRFPRHPRGARAP